MVIGLQGVRVYVATSKLQSFAYIRTGRFSRFVSSASSECSAVLNRQTWVQPGYQPEGIARLPEETRAARSIANAVRPADTLKKGTATPPWPMRIRLYDPSTIQPTHTVFLETKASYELIQRQVRTHAEAETFLRGVRQNR